MNPTAASRGRILSRQQVRLSDAPVALDLQQVCSAAATGPAGIQIETDPLTGDILTIRVTCGCGETTVIECQYDDETKVRR